MHSAKLNNPLVSGGDVFYFVISPDSTYVAYTADQDIDNNINVYKIAITGGKPLKMNGELVAGGNVQSPVYISPDSDKIVYSADQETDNLRELFVSYEVAPAVNDWMNY